MDVREGGRGAARSGLGRAAVTVAVVWCCVVAACTSTTREGTRSAPEVRAWVTTASGSQKLSDRGPVPFSTGRSGEPDIVVENGRRYQQFFGVGASITGASAVLLDTLPDDVRSRVMRDIFQPGQGIGLSVLRQPLGGNDFSTSDFSFTPGRDEDHVLPLLTEAARLDPSLAVVLSPWSAPASMKTSGSLVGGSLRPEDAGAYADYLVGAARAYLDAGVPVRGLTVQNEPSFSPPSYAGMTLDTEQQRTLLRDHVAPALQRAGLRLHLWALDDNFDRWPDADALLSDPATRQAVYGVAFHCYRGDVSALREIRDRHPGVAVSVSECSGGAWSDGFARELRYEARTMLVGAVRNGAAWLVKWNLALDPQGGPTNGGCQDCRGLVTVDPSTGTVTPSPTYYAFGHVGRFVTPGARVIGATARTGSDLDTVAFRNPDGSHVLVVFNDGSSTRDVRVDTGGRRFGYRLPAGALATFTW